MDLTSSDQTDFAPDEMVAFLSPVVALNLGLAQHILDTTSESERRRGGVYDSAHQMMIDFMGLCHRVPRDTAEWKYLFVIHTIVISISHGIGQHEAERTGKLAEAKEKRDRQVKNLSGGAIRIGLLRACWQVLMLGGLGYYLTQLLLPSLHWQEQRSPNLASLAVATAIILISSLVKSTRQKRNFNRIYDLHEQAIRDIELAYSRKMLREYQVFKEQAVQAWVEMTGKNPTAGLSYDMIMAQVLAGRIAAVRKSRRKWYSTYWFLVRLFLIHGIRKLKLRNHHKNGNGR